MGREGKRREEIEVHYCNFSSMERGEREGENGKKSRIIIRHASLLLFNIARTNEGGGNIPRFVISRKPPTKYLPPSL